MTYLLCAAVCTFLGLSNGLGGALLLRPVLDVLSPLAPESVASLCSLSALCSALVAAFFALNHRFPLEQDDLLIIAIGAVLGGILGEWAAHRFFSSLSSPASVFWQNALLVTLYALCAHYFKTLSRTIRPFRIDRRMLLPVCLICALAGSFLAFGAVPLSLMAMFLLFDAREEEASFAALTIALCAMAGKTLAMLIRRRFYLPDADALLWLLPGTVLGALPAMVPGIAAEGRFGTRLLKLGAYTALLNLASASLGG